MGQNTRVSGQRTICNLASFDPETHATDTHFEVELVDAFVGSAVDGAFSGELQRVKEGMGLGSERAAQLQEGVADPAGAVVHKLEKTSGYKIFILISMRKCQQQP